MKKLLLLTVSVMLAASLQAAENPDEITFKEFKAAVDSKKAILVDIAGTDSFKKGHVAGSINFEMNKNNLTRLLPLDKKTLIILYCCDKPACPSYDHGVEAIEALGYTNVKYIRQGVSNWAQAGLTIQKGM